MTGEYLKVLRSAGDNQGELRDDELPKHLKSGYFKEPDTDGDNYGPDNYLKNGDTILGRKGHSNKKQCGRT